MTFGWKLVLNRGKTLAALSALLLSALALAGCGGSILGKLPPGPISITTTVILDGVLGRTYNLTLGSTGGELSPSWSVTSGALPGGISLSATGILSGQPTETGSFSFTVTVDGGNSTNAAALTLVIQETLSVATAALANGLVDTAYSQTLTATGGLPDYTWSVVNTAADPPGLEMTTTGPDTGTYSGTPTTQGRFTFDIRVSDAGNQAVPSGSATATFTVLILNTASAYVTNSNDGTVSLIDITTNTVTGSITVGTNPLGVALSPEGVFGFVTNNGDNSVTVIDTLTNTATSTISVGTSPVGVTVPDSQSAYVANQGSNDISIIDIATNTVIFTLALPFPNSEPTGMATLPGGRFVFLTLRGADKALVLNNDPGSPAFHTIVAVLDTGSQPTGVAFAATTSQLYVANSGDGTISIFDADLNMLNFGQGETVDVGLTPLALGAGPNCNFVHVANSASNSFSVIDTNAKELRGGGPAGTNPQGIAFSPDGDVAFITNTGSDNVTVIDVLTSSVITTITVGGAPVGVAVTPNPTLRLVPTPPGPLPTGFITEPYEGRVCAAGGTVPYSFEAVSEDMPPGLSMDETGFLSGEPSEPSIPDFPDRFTFNVTVTDSATVPLTATGDFLLQICCFGTPAFAYVANFADNSVSVISLGLREVFETIDTGLGTNPLGVAITPDGRRTFVTNFNSDNVSVIDSEFNSATFDQVIATIAVGDGPAGVKFTPDSARAYVTNEDAGTVSVIDVATLAVTATITVGAQPEGLAITPDGLRVYVANIFSDTVSVIDTATNTVIATIDVDSGPVGVAVTPNGNRVYVTNQFADTVSVIDTATNTEIDLDTSTPEIDRITVGNFPTGIAITPGGSRAYVANQQEDTVSVINLNLDAEIDLDSASAGVQRIDVGMQPDFVATTSGGGRIYVTNFGGGTVSVITNAPGTDDDNTVLKTITVGTRPEGVAVQFGR